MVTFKEKRYKEKKLISIYKAFIFFNNERETINKYN